MTIFEKYPELLDHEQVASFDFANCWSRVNPDDQIGEFDVAVALVHHRGNLSRVGASLGKTRRRVESFVLKNLMLRDLYEDVHESLLDEVETAAFDLALSGHPATVKFLLVTRGRERGYQEVLAAPPPGDSGVRAEMTYEEMLEEAKRRGLPVEDLT